MALKSVVKLYKQCILEGKTKEAANIVAGRPEVLEVIEAEKPAEPIKTEEPKKRKK